MPLLTTNHALAAAAGALALTLYDRGIFQSVWAALHGPDVPLDMPAQKIGSGVYAPPGQPPAQNIGSGAGLGGVDFAAAGNAVIREGTPGGGSDWLNWCLNWVNRTYQKLGLGKSALGAGTALDACNQFSLKPGIAPKGAIVCFDSTEPGHIGLSNGNNTYTSAGLIHGGLAVRDYMSNPNYRGWTT